MFIACEELRNMAKSCRCRLHESDDFDSIIEEYSRLYYPHTGTPTDKVHFEFKLKEAKAIYDALSGEVTATISQCLKDIRDALTGSFIEKDPAIRNKGSVDIFSGSFNFQTVNP